MNNPDASMRDKNKNSSIKIQNAPIKKFRSALLLKQNSNYLNNFFY